MRIAITETHTRARSSSRSEVPQPPQRTEKLIQRILRSSSEMKCRLELELIQTQMTQKPMLRVEVGMHVRCANKASAE